MQQIVEREQWKNWEPEVDSSDLASHLLKSQQFCVVQTAHANSGIKSPDGNAWIRVIAFCPTLDNAYEIARNAHDSGDKMETRILQAGKCALVSRFKRVKGDLDKMLEDQKKANRTYDDYINERVKKIKDSKESNDVSKEQLPESKEISENKEVSETNDFLTKECQSGIEEIKSLEECKDLPESSESIMDSIPESKLTEPESKLTEPERKLTEPESKLTEPESKDESSSIERFPCTPISMEFGKPAEVFLQRYFAMAIIQDYDQEYSEPTVIPLCAAESMELLQELVTPLSKNIDLIHLDIFCGTSLEWMPLFNPKSNKVIHKHPLRQALEEKIKWVHE
jgi:hypothetical protein